MLTDEQIEMAKKRTKYRVPEADRRHEYTDSIRIAYEWLDAQTKNKKVNNKMPMFSHGLSGKVEAWGGLSVSIADVEVAAELHSDIIGRYPFYNIRSKLVEPSDERLKKIKNALLHYESYSYKHNRYSLKEK